MSVHMKQSLTTTEMRQIFTDTIVKLLETSSDSIIKQPGNVNSLQVKYYGMERSFNIASSLFVSWQRKLNDHWSDIGPVFRKWTRCMEAVHTHPFLIGRRYADIFEVLNQNSSICCKKNWYFYTFEIFLSLFLLMSDSCYWMQGCNRIAQVSIGASFSQNLTLTI